MSDKTKFYGTEYPGVLTPDVAERRVVRSEKLAFRKRAVKIGAVALAAVALTVGAKNRIEEANSPNGRAIPTHPVTVGNGIMGGTYTGEQGNVPAETKTNP